MPIAPTWMTPADTEPAACCVCGERGTVVYDLAPLAVVRCPSCRLAFVSPRLRAEVLGRLYGDPSYHAGMYDNSRGAMFLQRVWMDGRLKLARRLGPATGGRLLEIGSGRGMFLAAAGEAGFEVTGIELSEAAAGHARSRYGVPVHSTQLEQASLDGSFDVICFWDTLEHVPDPVAFWRTVRKLLAPDGVALFSTPYFSALPARVLRTRWWTLKPAEHIWQFTPRTHRRVAQAAGLTVERTYVSPLRSANFARLDSLVGVARTGA